MVYFHDEKASLTISRDQLSTHQKQQWPALTFAVFKAN